MPRNTVFQENSGLDYPYYLRAGLMEYLKMSLYYRLWVVCEYLDEIEVIPPH